MFGKDFLKGEIFLKVTEEDGSFKDHHVKNAVQEAWTNALFQVLCQGQHYEFSHTIGYMDVVANDGTSDGTKSYSVGTGDTNVVVDNVYDGSSTFYVRAIVSNRPGSEILTEVGSSQSGTIKQIKLRGSDVNVPINNTTDGVQSQNANTVDLTDTGEGLTIAINNTSSITLEYRVNLPAHATTAFDPSESVSSPTLSNYQGWSKAFLAGLCDVMTYGRVMPSGGITAHHSLASHTESGTTATDSLYTGNDNLRITSALLHKIGDTSLATNGSSESGTKDEHQVNHAGTVQTDSTKFSTAMPKSHIEINNSTWDYPDGQTADNVIASNISVQDGSPANVDVGSLQDTQDASVDKSSAITFSWTSVGSGQSGTAVAPDALVFYCRTIEESTAQDGSSAKYNKLHMSGSEEGHLVAYVLVFDPLQNFQAGDNISATVTFELNPT